MKKIKYFVPILSAGLLLLSLLFSNTPFSVLNIRYVEGDSMLPIYQTGTLVAVKPDAYAHAEPLIGDVAVYRKGDTEILHRIVRKKADGRYIFKGDNNPVEDPKPVDRSQIEGKVLFYLNFPAPLVRMIMHLKN